MIYKYEYMYMEAVLLRFYQYSLNTNFIVYMYMYVNYVVEFIHEIKGSLKCNIYEYIELIGSLAIDL